jgi:hypothetical protein
MAQNRRGTARVLELRYQGEVIGWATLWDFDCSGIAVEPSNEDAVYLNAAIIERLAA